ncbi:MAG: glycoside hydrolase family 15 protein [Firmicutes bacterium]|nr:glycoside hydrolase family 15 protein [Bacillota bacterium]
MPRDLPLSNGSLAVNFDSGYNLRELFYPHVGEEDHTEDHLSHFGIFVDGVFRWIDDPVWRRIRQTYEAETLVSDVILEEPQLGVRLTLHDAIDFERNVLIRQVKVDNLREADRQVRLFFHFDAHLQEANVGDTCFYDPVHRALIFYKRRRYFLLCGQAGQEAPGLSNFATGVKEFNGSQGTWKDAEDGRLEAYPVSQGSIDGVGEIDLQVGGQAGAIGWFWLTAGTEYPDALRLHDWLLHRTPDRLLGRTRSFWSAWLHKQPKRFEGVDPRLTEVYKRSLLVLSTQVDRSGAIIASTDADVLKFNRDTYAYLWPRDGALVAYTLDLCGYAGMTQRFYTFLADRITSQGFWLHKYNPDGSAGSSWHPWSDPHRHRQLPIQEDETALPLYALWHHYACFHDTEFVRSLYDRLILPAGKFLLAYRDAQTKLPRPSYDLWEERRGILTFTTATVVAGLQAAAAFAETFGDGEEAQAFSEGAQQVRTAMLQQLWDASSQRFVRMLTLDDQGRVVPDKTLDASLYAVFDFGVLPPDAPQVVATMSQIREQLWVQTPIGGIARYPGDAYHRVSEEIDRVPGNPWIICTLWYAEWLIAKATQLQEVDEALPYLQWVADHTLPSGVMAEQIDPYTGNFVSVSPLTWSQATYCRVFQEYVRKKQALAE